MRPTIPRIGEVLCIAIVGAISCVSTQAAPSSERDWLKELSRLPATVDVADWADRQKDLGNSPSGREFLRILQTSSNPERERTLALLAAHHLNAAQVEASLPRLLSDRSWMIRAGALRLIAGEGKPAHTQTRASQVLPVTRLLKDPALVVRWEAVKTLGRLCQNKTAEAACAAHAEPALIGVLSDARNFSRAGEPIWVPQSALTILMASKSKRAKDLSARLASLARKTQAQLWKQRLQSAAAKLPR